MELTQEQEKYNKDIKKQFKKDMKKKDDDLKKEKAEIK